MALNNTLSRHLPHVGCTKRRDAKALPLGCNSTAVATVQLRDTLATKPFATSSSTLTSPLSPHRAPSRMQSALDAAQVIPVLTMPGAGRTAMTSARRGLIIPCGIAARQTAA
jgi:hypothetical protein